MNIRFFAFPFALLIVFVFSVLFISSSTLAMKGTLDGKTFMGQLGEKGKDKGDPDELTFKEGKFSSIACQEYGFGEAPYTTTSSGNTTTFETLTVSEKEGKMKWSGTVTGNNLEVAAIWYKEGQAPIEYWFKGTLKN